MNSGVKTSTLHQLRVLLRGETSAIHNWIQQWDLDRTLSQVLVMIAEAGLYGASTGFWRDRLQAMYSSIKLPLLIRITTVATALLIGMLAPLLGLSLRFRQSFLTVLSSFVIASVILGAFSPILLFV